jgi:hypothetical protein
MLMTILIIVLILALIGGLPAWPHSRSWGYGPSGILGVIVVILLRARCPVARLAFGRARVHGVAELLGYRR